MKCTLKFNNLFLQSIAQFTAEVFCPFYWLLENYNPAVYGVLYQIIALQNFQPISPKRIWRPDPLKKDDKLWRVHPEPLGSLLKLLTPTFQVYIFLNVYISFRYKNVRMINQTLAPRLCVQPGMQGRFMRVMGGHFYQLNSVMCNVCLVEIETEKVGQQNVVGFQVLGEIVVLNYCRIHDSIM